MVEQETTDIECDKCGSPMVVKEGRFGKFLACSGYPKCRNTRPLGAEDLPCPAEGCDGQLVPRMTKKRRRFFGCNSYPKCDFATWDQPTAVPCPSCGSPVMLKKKGRSENGDLLCPRPGCGHRIPADEVPSR